MLEEQQMSLTSSSAAPNPPEGYSIKPSDSETPVKMGSEILGSNPGKEHTERSMQFSNHQISAVNYKLPPRFKLDPIGKADSRSSNKRKSEAENLDFDVRFQPRVQEKRTTREKRPVVYEEVDTVPRQGEAHKKINKILQSIKKNPMAEPFLTPVDPKEAPDYYEVIDEPMDLTTVEKKLRNEEYETAFQFAMDMRKIWSNSFYYNAKGSEMFQVTMELSSHFEKLMRGNEHLVLKEKKDIVSDLYRKVEKLSKGFKEMQTKNTATRVQVKPTERPMSIQEKKQLCQNIKKLEPRFLRGVLDIVKESMDVQGEELEFDIDKLPTKTCRELEKYVKQCLQTSSRSQKKKKPSTVNIEGIKAATDASSSRLHELDNQLEQIAQQTKQETATKEEESQESESSSSSSESEEEDIPAPQQPTSAPQDNPAPSVSSMWNSFLQQTNQIDEDDAFNNMNFSA